MIDPQRPAAATLLLPCLNEAASLRAFLTHCSAVLTRDTAANWKILLADNGSTDGSGDIARALGVEVIEVSPIGYGAAVSAGIRHASTEWVVYADTDATYLPEDAVAMLALARRDEPDLLVGSRFLGTIHPGAMPWSHRYVGTPVLSWLLRVLHGIPVTDCNSGIRCVRRDQYLRWNVRSRGMEHASDLLIRAAANGARIRETPAQLVRTPGFRVPHLRTWTDGMRHLLVILASSPNFFWRAGTLLLFASLLLALPCSPGAPNILGRYGFQGEHLMMVALLIGFHGALATNLAIFLHSHSEFPKVPASLQLLLGLREGALFWWLVATVFSIIGACIYVGKVTTILFFLYVCVVHSTLLFGVLQARLNTSGRQS